MHKIALLICFFCSFFACLAQVANNPNHYCYTDEMWNEMVHRDSSLLVNRRQIEEVISKKANKQARAISKNQQTHDQSAAGGPAITVIPVVIYVVYDSAPVNISMTQIQSQIDQLNTNLSPYGFSFCYAKLNVLNNKSFTPLKGDSAGVFRIKSTLSNENEYNADAQLKALSNLPWQNYLRIFIVHSISPTGVLGYTIFPGTNSSQDGIVILSDVFGSNNYCDSCNLNPTYNLGAVLTHEVGHFLDLYHTFQGGCDTGSGLSSCQLFGDQVCDTPPTDGSFGCPNPSPLSCDGITPVLIDNYMDYTDDRCKTSFTAGQKARMDVSTQIYRSELVSTANLINTGVTCVQLGAEYADFYCANYNGCVNMPMTFTSLNSNGVLYNWNFGDGDTAQGASVQHTYSSAGKFPVTLNAADTMNGVNATSTTPVFITTCSPTTCSLNRWDGEYNYLDFSSGTPVATNHPTAYANPSFADCYTLFYRGDGAGNALFNIGSRNLPGSAAYTVPLLDTSFNTVAYLGDSFTYSNPAVLVPVPGHVNTYCDIENLFTQLTPGGQGYDTLAYSIIQAQDDSIFIPAGKKHIKFPFPVLYGYATLFYDVTAIPNCDGTKLWIIVYRSGGFSVQENVFIVFEFDSTEQMTYRQTFGISDSATLNGSRMSPSPNGKMIAFGFSTPKEFGAAYLDFDKNAGNILNYHELYKVPNLQFSFSTFACFSPNSRFLYYQDTCCSYAKTYMANFCQSDMYAPEPYASRKVLFQLPGESDADPPYLGYRIGPDKKLYIVGDDLNGNANDYYRLALISNPDTLENGFGITGYNPNGPDMRPVNCPYGTNFFLDPVLYPDNTAAFGCDWHPKMPDRFSYFTLGCYNYKFYSDECWSAIWDFGDSASNTLDSSTLNNPTHLFSGKGNYAVKLITNGYIFIDTIRIGTPDAEIAATAFGPCTLPFGNYSVANVQPGIVYNWSITNGSPLSAFAQTNIDVAWNTNDSTGSVMVVAIDPISGCADTALLNVNYINSLRTTALNAHICYGDVYSFNGRLLTEQGVYVDTLQTVQGCDSIITLTLLVNGGYTDLSANLCSGSSYSFNGRVLTNPGIYIDSLSTMMGCDSIIELSLSENKSITTSFNVSICVGESYDFNDVILSDSGTYSDTLLAADGCDSIVNLLLKVLKLPDVTWATGVDTLSLQSAGVILSGGMPQGGSYSGPAVADNTFYPAQAGQGSVIINYTYVDSNGCSNTVSHNFVVTALQALNYENIIYVYPNPAGNEVIIRSPLFESDDIEVALKDITGRRIIATAKKYPDRIVFDISAFSAGWYFFDVVTKIGVINKPFVKIDIW